MLYTLSNLRYRNAYIYVDKTEIDKSTIDADCQQLKLSNKM